MTDANLPAGNSKEGNINLSFTEASISEEPSAVVPHEFRLTDGGIKNKAY